MKTFFAIIFTWIIPMIISFNLIGNTVLFKNNQDNKDNKGDSSKLFIKLKCGLYINKMGDIGFLAFDRTKNKEIKRYLTYVYNADTLDNLNAGVKEMKYVVDTLTFKFLSKIYFKDKNHIYVFNPMEDGGTIEINWDTDLNTFTVLAGGVYAIDNKDVYYRGKRIIGADKKSFKNFTSNKLRHYAYDNFNFYSGDEKISLTEARRLGLDKLKKQIVNHCFFYNSAKTFFGKANKSTTLKEPAI